MTRERWKPLLGGSFTDLSNNFTGKLARFRPNGTLDTSFQPAINGMVSSIVVHADGRIVISSAGGAAGIVLLEVYELP